MDGKYAPEGPSSDDCDAGIIWIISGNEKDNTP